MNTSPKYGDLKVISWIIRILAWVILIAGVGAGIGAMIASAGFVDNFLARIGVFAVVFLVVGVVNFLQLYIIGALLSLLVDVERNTRANAVGTQQLYRLVESRPVTPLPPPPPPAPAESS